MKVKLLKDIVIPAGTVFDTAPRVTTRHGIGHVSKIIGLSKDTSGSFTYDLGETDKEREQLKEWFEQI